MDFERKFASSYLKKKLRIGVNVTSGTVFTQAFLLYLFLKIEIKIIELVLAVFFL